MADADLAQASSPTSFWREARLATIRLGLIKIAARITEMVTRIKVALPTACPYHAGFAMLAGQIVKLPPKLTGRLPHTKPSGQPQTLSAASPAI